MKRTRKTKPKLKTKCIVSKCTAMSISRGLCTKHYSSWTQTHKDKDIEVFAKYVDIRDEQKINRKCSVPECEAETRARNLCREHYDRWLNNFREYSITEYINKKLYVKKSIKCVITECDSKPKGRGLCHKHYSNWAVNHQDKTVVEFISYVEKRDSYVNNIHETYERTCRVNSCCRDTISRGLCRKHYGQWYSKNRDLTIDKFIEVKNQRKRKHKYQTYVINASNKLSNELSVSNK